MKLQILCFSFFLSSFSFAICDQLQLDPDLPKTPFEHSSSNTLSWFQFHHNTSDVITVIGREALFNAQFSYGVIHKDLEDEKVEIWIDTCGQQPPFLRYF